MWMIVDNMHSRSHEKQTYQSPKRGELKVMKESAVLLGRCVSYVWMMSVVCIANVVYTSCTAVENPSLVYEWRASDIVLIILNRFFPLLTSIILCKIMSEYTGFIVHICHISGIKVIGYCTKYSFGYSCLSEMLLLVWKQLPHHRHHPQPAFSFLSLEERVNFILQ